MLFYELMRITSIFIYLVNLMYYTRRPPINLITIADIVVILSRIMLSTKKQIRIIQNRLEKNIFLVFFYFAVICHT